MYCYSAEMLLLDVMKTLYQNSLQGIFMVPDIHLLMQTWKNIFWYDYFKYVDTLWKYYQNQW